MKHFILTIATKVNYARMKKTLIENNEDFKGWFENLSKQSFQSRYGKPATMLIMVIGYAIFSFVSRGLYLVEVTSWEFMINRVLTGDALTEFIVGVLFAIVFVIMIIFMISILLETPLENLDKSTLIDLNDTVKSFGYKIYRGKKHNQVYILKY